MAEQDPDGLEGEWSFPPESQEELLALARMLRRARGTFALAFVRCNVVPMRERLVALLKDALAPAGVTIHETALDANAPDIPAALSGAPGDGDPLFVYDLERTMPSRSPRWAQAQLNERRPLYQKLGRPLVFWLPDYALQLVARGAPDFWAWRSGVYEFALPETGREVLLDQVSQVGWLAQRNLDRVAAEARLHLLRGMLDEYAPEGGGRAETLRKLADLERTLVGYQVAEGRLQEALRIYEELGDRRGVAVTQLDLAYLYRLRGEYEAAEQLYRQSLQTKEELGDRREMAATQGQLAELYRLRGEYEAAEELYTALLQTLEELGDRRSVAVAQGQLAYLYLLRGEYEAAEELYTASLQTKEELGDRREVAVTLHNLALMRQEQGRTGDALALLARSRDINISLGLDKDVATVEKTIAEIRSEMSKE